MRRRGGEGRVATVLILSKTADAAAADAAANQTHLWWYPLGYNTNPHPTFHPDSASLFLSPPLSLSSSLSLGRAPSPSSHPPKTPFSSCLSVGLLSSPTRTSSSTYVCATWYRSICSTRTSVHLPPLCSSCKMQPSPPGWFHCLRGIVSREGIIARVLFLFRERG